MDTSKEYIKMCKKVDLGFEFNIGDCVFLDNKVQPIIYADYQHHMVDNSWESYIKVPSSLKLFDSEEAIPIYRQDQLQAMITTKCIRGMVYQFKIFVNTQIEFDLEWSMEQLWLAFVMAEKYQKHWNGRDWVKREE